jgi:tetratricopeptide (TPR) repeat protein
MVQKRFRVLGLLLLIVLITGCVAASLDEAKRQYAMALQSDNPWPHYNAALEELNAAIARDPNFLQAYAIRGLIYVQYKEFDLATNDLKKAEQGSFGGELQWVPVVINMTYGDIFHEQAGAATQVGDWERAKSYQEAAIQFFDRASELSFGNLGEMASSDELGISIENFYIQAQGRWAAGKHQMALIVGKMESKERQSELLREANTRLSAMVENYPDSASLRYRLAEGYRKQALTIKKTEPEESERLQEQAMTQLRICAEIGLPIDLREPAAQLFSTLSNGAEPEIEMKIRGSASSQ